jgi:hypothetical protein
MGKVQILKPRIDAELANATANAETRTVDFQFYSGATVRRYSWTKGEYTLAFSMDGVRLDQLNSGRAPVLETHSDYSTKDVLGVIEKGWVENGRGMARVRFAKGDPAADQVWNKIEQKILRNVSMGAVVHKMKDTSKENDKIKSYLAVDWEPLEISVVPIGADPDAQIVMSDQAREMLSVEVEAVERAESLKEHTLENPIETGTSREVQLAAQEALADQLKAGKELGITQELARVTTINKTAQALNLSASFANKHIEARTTVEEFRRLAIDEQARISTQFSGTGVRVMRDETDTRRELMGSAVFGLMSPKDKVQDTQNPFRGLSIFQIAQESVRLQHGLAGLPTKANIATLAMQSTADFANVLENSARKQLQARYQYANPTYRLWTKRSTTPDFKTMSRPRLGEAPTFIGVPEGAQITLGTMSDSKETYGLATYGRGLSFTRQMLINDDVNAFNDLIGAFGVQAARLENKTVYAILTANAAMSDGVTLFHGTHGNSGTGVIGNTALDAMFTAMGVQKGIDGVSVLNLTPKFLIVPKAKESTARAALMAIGPNVKASDQNWFAGRLEPIADAELDATSTAVWYAACDPSEAPGIEYAHLEGAEGPQFIRKDNESGVLGVQFYAYLDFAAKAIDWRPLYYSTGA